MRLPLLAANWKMNLGQPLAAADFVRRTRLALGEVQGVEVVICPPYTALAAVEEALRGTRLRVGAQNVHSESKGAFTGEISAEMLKGLCAFVILGHSERRASGSLDETDQAIQRKVQAAFASGLTPILCVGEDHAQNESGKTSEIVGSQVRAALGGLARERAAACVIAYEPIWAIGTGKAATPADANGTVSLTIRGALADLFGQATADTVRVLYGGSVTVENIAAFMAMPDLDGALVGGASLKDDFPELVRRAAAAKNV
ncbi:MAG TPA: triose-phosphate isomerase [Anaerolineales bacterium]|nr:triose-phosphate isomerase [Anaerolineales bacterium]